MTYTIKVKTQQRVHKRYKDYSWAAKYPNATVETTYPHISNAGVFDVLLGAIKPAGDYKPEDATITIEVHE